MSGSWSKNNGSKIKKRQSKRKGSSSEVLHFWSINFPFDLSCDCVPFLCRTSLQIQEMLGSIDTSSALAAYERMEEKVLRMEAEADALNEIASDQLETKVSSLNLLCQQDTQSCLPINLTISVCHAWNGRFWWWFGKAKGRNFWG